jgi:hypothetical protein
MIRDAGDKNDGESCLNRWKQLQLTAESFIGPGDNGTRADMQVPKETDGKYALLPVETRLTVQSLDLPDTISRLLVRSQRRVLKRTQDVTGDSSDIPYITVWKSWVIQTTNSKGTAIQRAICIGNKYWYLGGLQ